MTPLDAAAEKAIPREWGSVTPTPGDYETARRVIRAFLEAAAEDADTAFRVGEAALVNFPELGPRKSMGVAAILALKETL